MRVRYLIGGAVALVTLATTTSAQDVPGWVRLLHFISGDNVETSVPVMAMGRHMQMSERLPARPEDRRRAQAIVDAARTVLVRFPTTAAAEKAGYKPFHQTGAMGEEIHYTSLGASYAEGKNVDYSRPGSILFQRTPAGVVPVGVMYAAPSNVNQAQLDQRAPLSVATWHRHVNFCLPTGRDFERLMQGPQFGYDGSFTSAAACQRAGGYWLPLAFGWMTHVYPNRRDQWGGEEMQPDGAPTHH